MNVKTKQERVVVSIQEKLNVFDMVQNKILKAKILVKYREIIHGQWYFQK